MDHEGKKQSILEVARQRSVLLFIISEVCCSYQTVEIFISIVTPTLKTSLFPTGQLPTYSRSYNTTEIVG